MNIFSADVINDVYQNHYLPFLFLVAIGAFVSTWYLIPKIIWVTHEKDLNKPVIGRSAHTRPIPAFGGVAFFVTLVLALSLIQVLELSKVGNHLIAALTILFMVGIKDDLVVSTARVKLIGQLVAIGFLVFLPGFEISSLHGFLGVEEIPAWFGVALGAFVVLGIINSYNLIDGIDGLAAVTGMIIGSIYTGIFYITGQHFYVLVSLTLVGMLGGFLRFNYSKGRRKILMGDSGSLVVGLLIGFLTLRVLSYDASLTGDAGFALDNTIPIIVAILFVPFFDTTRSIVIRLLNGKSPFEPDRNHTHHILLDAGCNHFQATCLLGLLNIGVFSLVYSLSTTLGNLEMSLLLFVIFSLSCGLFYAIKKKYPSKADLAIAQIKAESEAVMLAETKDTAPVMPVGYKVRTPKEREERRKKQKELEVVNY